MAQSAFNKMVNTKLQYRKTGGRQYYHIMQAFHPDEPITPETAHEIALRFAEENFPGYEVLVATHVDRHHIHSHFVLNSVNAETGLKFHSGNHEIQRLRDASDRLCISMGKRNTTVSYEYRGTDLAFHATFDTITIAVDERQQKHPSFSFWGVPFSFLGVLFSFRTYNVLSDVRCVKFQSGIFVSLCGEYLEKV